MLRSSLLRVAPRASASVNMASAMARPMATYTEQQDKKGRPISPHVMIYAWPVTAISSISNRVSGAALGVGNV